MNSVFVKTVFLVCTFTGPLVVNSQEIPQPYHFSFQSLKIINTSHVVKKDSGFSGSVALTGIRLRMKDWQPVLDAKPVFEIIPYGECLTVNVTNVGWGDVPASDLKLSQLDYSQHDQLASLASEEQRLSLLKPGSQKTIVFRQLENLGFRIRGRTFNPIYSNDDLIGNWSVENTFFPKVDELERSSSTDSQLEYNRVRVNTQSQYIGKQSGFIQFSGELTSPNGDDTKLIPYYAKKLQCVDLSSQESELANLLKLGLGGAITPDWEIFYGSSQQRPQLFGLGGRLSTNLTVKFDDPRSKQIVSVPLPAIEVTDDGFRIDLVVHCSKPGKFQLEVAEEYLVNDSVKTTGNYHLLKGGKEFQFDKTKNYDTNWLETRGYVNRLFESDEELLSSLRKSTLPNLVGIGGKSDAVRQSDARKWCDLCLAEFVNDSNSEKTTVCIEQTTEWIREFLQSGWAIPPNLNSFANSDQMWIAFEKHAPEAEILRRVFPLIVRKNHEFGAELAVRQYKAGIPRALATAICFNSCRNELQNRHKDNIVAILSRRIVVKEKEANAPSSFNDRPLIDDLFAAALVDSDRLDFILESSWIPTNAIGVASGLSSHPSIRLRIQKLPSFNSGIIEGLTAVGDKTFLPDVQQAIWKTLKSPKDRGQMNKTLELLSALKYLRRFNSNKLDGELLRTLTKYQHDSRVREIAKRIIGEE